MIAMFWAIEIREPRGGCAGENDRSLSTDSDAVWKWTRLLWHTLQQVSVACTCSEYADFKAIQYLQQVGLFVLLSLNMKALIVVTNI